ncbi:hypothetical protein NQ318_006586 [Aromia moschata]|uniref:Uncharacterized protein n=1 Tax=Aromia moschata TaxID=1265417 RepID=A0AAV8XYL2_9CUCU|nr:hypothetical protein NQ318_006586 [Aromia moschata]
MFLGQYATFRCTLLLRTAIAGGLFFPDRATGFFFSGCADFVCFILLSDAFLMSNSLIFSTSFQP